MWVFAIARVDTASADAELRDYRLHALESRVQTMQAGTERDYYSGVLAARFGRFDEAIGALRRALPALRASQPKHAAIALEALATAYRANNQYAEAASVYAELSEHFKDQLEHFPSDDAALARILSGTPAQSINQDRPGYPEDLEESAGLPQYRTHDQRRSRNVAARYRRESVRRYAKLRQAPRPHAATRNRTCRFGRDRAPDRRSADHVAGSATRRCYGDRTSRS
jgi:hypothetical protein